MTVLIHSISTVSYLRKLARHSSLNRQPRVASNQPQ